MHGNTLGEEREHTFVEGRGYYALFLCLYHQDDKMPQTESCPPTLKPGLASPPPFSVGDDSQQSSTLLIKSETRNLS